LGTVPEPSLPAALGSGEAAALAEGGTEGDEEATGVGAVEAVTLGAGPGAITTTGAEEALAATPASGSFGLRSNKIPSPTTATPTPTPISARLGPGFVGSVGVSDAMRDSSSAALDREGCARGEDRDRTEGLLASCPCCGGASSWSARLDTYRATSFVDATATPACFAASSSASEKSAAVGKRSAGSVARAREQTAETPSGTAGFTWAGVVGAPCAT
jgi:hypothetical protein